MISGYCIKCRRLIEIEEPKMFLARDRKRWMRGNCPNCGTPVWKRLREKEQSSRILYALSAHSD